MTRYDLDFPDLEPEHPDAAATDSDLADRPFKPALTIAVDTKAGARSHTLLVPLKVNGKWLRQITLRLPSQGQIDDYVNDENRSRRLLLAELAGVDPLIIKALRWPDSEAVHQIFHDIVPQFISEG